MKSIQQIKSDQAKQWLDNNEANIIDVREQAEYAESNIPGATLYPLSEFDAESIISKLDISKKLIVQCRSGGRSQTAIKRLLEAGYTGDLYNLDGGIISWIEDYGYSFSTK